jgi:hypothetical protein
MLEAALSASSTNGSLNGIAHCAKKCTCQIGLELIEFKK